MRIAISNCNNVDSGEIEIQENKLNIKYAINGTGKSTIAHAIEKNMLGKVNELRPFKYLNDNEEVHNPQIHIDGQINKVCIFNEDYVNKYVFKKEDVLENSFEIFVRTEQYDKHMEEIERLISTIANTFKENPELDQLINDLTVFINSFGNTQNGYSKSGELGKSLGKGNKLQSIPDDLKVYEPFLKATGTSVKWLKWQVQGKEYLEIAEKCPYCVSTITTPKETILKVSDEYDTKYLALLSKILEVFDSLKHYFNDSTQQVIDGIVVNTDGISDQQVEYLKSVKAEVSSLRDSLVKLKFIGFNALKDVDRVVVELEKLKINLDYFPKMNCNYTKSKIDTINTSLQQVIERAGELQGEIAKQKKEIAKTIEKYSNKINGFLASAGYKYFVTIEQPEGEEQYKLMLKFLEGQETVAEARTYLSYGERNAFALVLFMYQAIKEKADFVVLDDPISSFDNNKKYAILNMLFRGKDSFQDKTVLMLTHDFEPIIDSIYNMAQYFQPKPVAAYLANINGQIEEKKIEKNDIKSFLEICGDNMEQSQDILHKLIYYRRFLEITQSKGLEWQLVSNVFHKDRDKPIYQPDNSEPKREMTQDELEIAQSNIRHSIPEFDYNKIYRRIKDRDELIAAYNSCKSGYEKVQIYRIMHDGDMEKGSAIKKYIDESFHVQNDFLFQLNPREYKIVPQYILDFCDKSVEEEQVKQEVVNE